jgi:hypothetical protein
MQESNYQIRLYKDTYLQNPIKKGLTSFITRKPLLLLVGTGGIEPVTSTV